MKVRSGRLVLGGIPAQALAGRFGTPLYAYEEDMIRRQARRLRGAVPLYGYRPRYSLKANTNPHLVRIALQEGLELEAVSPGEIALALRCGASPSKVHYTSNGMTRFEMAYALRQGVSVTVDSLQHLAMYARLRPRGALSVRLNPGAGDGHHAHVVTGGPLTKFGVPVEHAGRLRREAARLGLRITGLHMHIGSNFLDPRPFLAMVDVMLAAALGFPDLRGICVGGGFGIAYRTGRRSLDVEAFGPMLARRFLAFGRPMALAVEPGRFLVCEAGFLLTRVVVVHRGTRRTFVITDTGFNHLIRPILYDAYHPILHAARANARPSMTADVCGNLCETGDIFRKACRLPRTEAGDILAITHAGAYGFSMASTYNTRPLPMEVLVKRGKARVIRRRETPEALAARMMAECRPVDPLREPLFGKL